MLTEIIFCGVLAIIAGAMADTAESRLQPVKALVLILIMLAFCGLALWAGLAWAIQIKGAL